MTDVNEIRKIQNKVRQVGAKCIISLLAIAFVGYLFFRIFQKFPVLVSSDPELFKKLLEFWISFLGTLLGFIISVLTIQTALFDSEHFRSLRQSDKPVEILGHFVFLCFLTFLSFLLLVASYALVTLKHVDWAVALALASILVWSFEFFRTMKIFFETLVVKFTSKPKELYKPSDVLANTPP